MYVSAFRAADSMSRDKKITKLEIAQYIFTT